MGTMSGGEARSWHACPWRHVQHAALVLLAIPNCRYQMAGVRAERKTHSSLDRLRYHR